MCRSGRHIDCDLPTMCQGCLYNIMPLRIISGWRQVCELRKGNREDISSVKGCVQYLPPPSYNCVILSLKPFKYPPYATSHIPLSSLRQQCHYHPTAVPNVQTFFCLLIQPFPLNRSLT